MGTPSTPRARQRAVRAVHALLPFFLAAVLALTTAGQNASAASVSTTGDRVEAVPAVSILRVGPTEDIAAGQHPDRAPPHPRVAEGHGVHTYYVLPTTAGGTTTGTAVLVHNAGPCDVDADGLAHVVERHTLGGALRDANAGVFDDGLDLAELARGSAEQIGRRNPATGNIEYDVTRDGIVGVTGGPSGGLPTRSYKIVRDPYGGDLVTMYPVG